MNSNLDKLSNKLAKNIKKGIINELMDTATSTNTCSTTQSFDFDEIEKLIATAKNIKKEASDKLYNNLKDKVFIVPSESSKLVLYEALKNQIGNRAYWLNIKVSYEVDNIIVIDSKYFDK